MLSSKNTKIKHYLAMWDMQGLECIFDVTKAMNEIEQWEKEAIWSTLKEESRSKRPNPIPLQMMILRARANSQRSYEIYEFTSLVSIEEVKEAFNSNPQPLVEWIRENGKKVYSDYVKREQKMIM